MKLKTEKTIAFFFAGALLIVGIVCYAAFPQRSPDMPVRIMFKSLAGNVLFSHTEHVSEDYYGYECTDCHHYYDEEDPGSISCSECHMTESDEDEDIPKRSDAMHSQCIDCHKESGGGPDECSECHVQ
ncbi:MAG: cytochrome c3 family protein [Deltaproteobacteria bacterium]|nr:cytochrome c3 family protein [Deltaproteobacteria bacterium]